MRMVLFRRVVLAAVGTQLLFGCASTPGVALSDRTLLLGEVIHVLPRDLVTAGEFVLGEKRNNRRQNLDALQITNAQIEQRRVVVVRRPICWNNTISGRKYSQLLPDLIADGLAVAPGNIVEVGVGERGATVQRVRAGSLAKGGCHHGDVPVSEAVEVLVALSGVGARGSASLYGAGIETEGWHRPRTYWHKLPGTATDTTVAAVPPTPISTEPAPETMAASSGMADLVISLRPMRRGVPAILHYLPVRVDREEVAELAQCSCDVVQVPPGEHTVVAGSAEKSFLRSYARHELPITVGAGSRLVLDSHRIPGGRSPSFNVR